MPKFRVVVLGQNLLADVDGARRRMGFFTTVFVEAASPEQAGTLALERIRTDPKLRALALNPPDDPLRLSVDDFGLMDSFADVRLPRTGLALFPEDDSGQD